MVIQQLPLDLTYQICSGLDCASVASLCLVAKQLHSRYQPHLLRSKGALDRAYKWSVSRGDLVLFRQVLALGKYANLSAVCLAAKHGQTEIVRELLQSKDILKAVLDGNCDEVRHWGHPLAAAAKAGHADVVRLLLSLPGSNPNLELPGRRQPLLQACVYRRGTEVLDVFLEHGASVRETIGADGEPRGFLSRALSQSTWATCVRLKEAGALDDLDLHIFTAVAGSMRGVPVGLRRLYRLASRELRVNRLHLEGMVGSGLDLSFVADALASKPDIRALEAIGLLASTFRYHSSEGSASGVVQVCELLANCGEKLDNPVFFRDRMLQLAARQHLAIPLLEILLKVPSCPSPSVALGWVRTPETARMLINRGASVHARDSSLETPLTTFLSRVDPDEYDVNKQTVREVVRVFLAEGADAAAVTDAGYNPMARVMYHCGADKVLLQLLLDHGAQMNPSSENPAKFWHPLPGVMRLPKDQRVGMTDWLLERGADIEGRDLMNRTALQNAAMVLDAPLLANLLRRGATIHESKYSWDSALHCASNWATRPQQNGFRRMRPYVSPATDEDRRNFLECSKLLLETGVAVDTDSERERYWPGALDVPHLEMYFARGMPANGPIRWRRSGRHMPLQQGGEQEGTLLHYAVEKRDIAFVRRVLQEGGDPSATNPDGLTPWRHAVRYWRSVDTVLGCTRESMLEPSSFMKELHDSDVFKKQW